MKTIRALSLVILLVACGGDGPRDQGDGERSKDARICEAALKVPWNSPLMSALTRDPQTPIQEQARLVEDLFDLGDPNVDTNTPWDELSRMCIDAGF